MEIFLGSSPNGTFSWFLPRLGDLATKSWRAHPTQDLTMDFCPLDPIKGLLAFTGG